MSNNYSLQQLIYGETTVNIDQQGLWNATALVQAYNKKNNKDKRLNNWLRAELTQELLSEIKESVALKSADLPRASFEDLVRTVSTDPGFGGGTWIHPKLVLPLAHWLSPSFYVWCNDKLEELLTKERLDNAQQLRQLDKLRPLIEQPKLERYVQKLLEKSLDGYYGSYLKLASGIPDLITEKFIIEIKDAPNWKHALGQLQAYKVELTKRREFDGRVCIAYLFDRGNWLTEARKDLIKATLNSFDFEVWWHSIIEDETLIEKDMIEADQQLQKFLRKLEVKDAIYIAIEPDGTKHYAQNLKQWCLKRGLNYSAAMAVLKGKYYTDTYKGGYRFEYATEQAANETLSQKRSRAATKNKIIAQCVDTSKTYLITNLNEWLALRNVKSSGNVYEVLKGGRNDRPITRSSAYGYRFWYLKECPPEILTLLDLD